MDFDIPNWLALVIEIGIAIPFAIYLYAKQRKVGKQLEDIVFKQEQLRSLRHDFGIINIKNNLTRLKETLEEVNSHLESCVSKNDSNNEKIVREIRKEFEFIISHYVDSIKNTVNIMADVLDPIESQKVLDVCMTISYPPIPHNELQVGQNLNIMNKIDNILNYLNSHEREHSDDKKSS